MKLLLNLKSQNNVLLNNFKILFFPNSFGIFFYKHFYLGGKRKVSSILYNVVFDIFNIFNLEATGCLQTFLGQLDREQPTKAWIHEDDWYVL